MHAPLPMSARALSRHWAGPTVAPPGDTGLLVSPAGGRQIRLRGRVRSVAPALVLGTPRAGHPDAITVHAIPPTRAPALRTGPVESRLVL
jgi:hypothetical protein